ncbi:hypothetical protein C0J52_20287 [Blattella germanica]|nr:hypothetical protein C0J52_20287 [Blattella germanica]
MEDIVNDSRFSHITKDPRFKRIPKWEKKIKIDKRFQSMFKDKQFKLNYAVDKRGRPVIRSSSEDLKKYYALSSSSSDDDDDNDNDNDSNDNDAKVSISSEEKLDKKKENSSEHRISLKKSKLNKDQIDSSETESFSEPYKREEKGLTECVKEKLRDLTVDYARGGGVLFSDSSSEEEGSDIGMEKVRRVEGSEWSPPSLAAILQRGHISSKV